MRQKKVISGPLRNKVKLSLMKHAAPLIMCLKVVCVLTCPVSFSDVMLLLLILHYSGSLRQSFIYALVYPFIFLRQPWMSKCSFSVEENQ